MKKDQPRQDRRRRALERLVIKPMTPHPAGLSPEQRHERETQHAAYVARKTVEQAALRSALGI